MSASSTSNNKCIIPIGTTYLRIFEDLNDENDDEEVEDNVGRLIWPTSLPMMTHINQEISPLCSKDTIVVELGSGCGLLGMGLAILHKFEKVIITDHDYEWLQRNLDLNSNEIGKEVIAMRLEWGNESEVDTVSKMIHQACHSRDSNVLVLASDVLYNHESHENLVYTLYKLSSLEISTRILIGFLTDRDNDEASFLVFARNVFGDTFPSAKSIFLDRKGKDKSRQIELHLIDFVV